MSSSPRFAGCLTGTWPSRCCAKLLEGEIKQRSKKNMVQSRSFAEMLEKSIIRYQNRAIETAAGDRGADRTGEGHA